MWFSLLIGCATKTTIEDSGTESTDTALSPDCLESAAGELPAEAVWITLDGQSTQLLSPADSLLDSNWQGQYGTYDLNTVAFEGANGFLLEHPGTVVAAQAKWSNLSEEERPVGLTLWPDFGSNGYMWDSDNPYATETRCLSAADDGEWVDYVLPSPIRVEHPVHVFAGYSRAERESGSPATEPELWMENQQIQEEPFATGAWFMGVDDELYHKGMANPWYIWQVRLAVVYDEPAAAADQLFSEESFTVSSRVAWGDVDNDGDDDLMTSGPVLYENDGQGNFTDITSSAIVTSGSSSGGVWGDFDNDGCLDFFGQGGDDILLHNNCDRDGEGYFLSDVTVLSGIHDLQTVRDCNGDGEEESSPTEGSGWLDVDNDGWLDIYLANYECWSEHDYFKNYDDRLWRNNHDGTFSEWTSQASVPPTNHAGRGVTVADADLDGDSDVFVSNYRLDPNYYLENQGDGSFRNISLANGTQGVQVAGAYGHTIGTVFGDVDNDGDFDQVQANLAHPFFYWFSDKSAVLINDGSGSFTDEGAERGLYYRETHSNPTLFDADNDGDQDLFITSVYSSRDSDFYLNDGSGHFSLHNHDSGLVMKNGWGAAAADVDNDGDLDIVSRTLFRNQSAAGSWLKVRVFGGITGGPADSWGEWRGASNVHGLGAVVRITTSAGIQMQQVSGGSGTGVQDSLTLHFGLGDASPSKIEVLFLGGGQVAIENPTANQMLWVHEDGSSTEGWDFPSGFVPQR